MLTLPNASYLELLACLDIGSNSFIVDFFGPMFLCSNSRLELPTGVDSKSFFAFLSFVFSV